MRFAISTEEAAVSAFAARIATLCHEAAVVDGTSPEPDVGTDGAVTSMLGFGLGLSFELRDCGFFDVRSDVLEVLSGDGGGRSIADRSGSDGSLIEDFGTLGWRFDGVTEVSSDHAFGFVEQVAESCNSVARLGGVKKLLRVGCGAGEDACTNFPWLAEGDDLNDVGS